MTRRHFQIAVIGSGFAGTLTALIAHRLGLSTVLIERGRHPRFVIGESSTPLANLLLEEIAGEYNLPFVRPLSKWGTWQKELPQIACGLKRGFTFYHHEFGRPFAPDPDHRRQLLVGASPNETVADTHWYRPEFDQYLVQQAVKNGLTYWDEANLTEACERTEGMSLKGTRHGQKLEIKADFVIDATGPRGFLHRHLALPEKEIPSFPATQGLFAHFRKVGVLSPNFSVNDLGLPYPAEQAAMHHIFPGGWIWVLKFNNGITSAGVAATDALASELNFFEGEAAWHRLLERLPSLAEIFQSAETITSFTHSPRLSFQSGKVAGSNWVLLPYAAGFVDPLLSTGFPLTLLGVKRLAGLLKSDWGGPAFQRGLAAYAEITKCELEAAAELIGALYSTMNRFDLFKNLTLLYFAAASYSETVRRLGKPHLADSFLLNCHAQFGPQLLQICRAARSINSQTEADWLSKRIIEVIQPFDVAGLSDRSSQSWYPAKAGDLFDNCAKVAATREEILAMLQRCGWRGEVPRQ